MATYSTTAINIKSYNLSENDKIIVFYSRELGIVRAVAKGVKKSTSKLSGRMELLIANKLLVSKGKSLDIISQAETVEKFKGLRKDLDKLTYSLYVSEVILNFGMENDINAKYIYEILYNTLKNIELAASEKEILWSVCSFLLRFMKLEGYELELKKCSKCQIDLVGSNLYFDNDSGGALCNSCKSIFPQRIEISEKLMNIMINMSIFEFFEENLQTEQLLLCFNILKDYVASKCHKKFKSPELLEAIC